MRNVCFFNIRLLFGYREYLSDWAMRHMYTQRNYDLEIGLNIT